MMTFKYQKLYGYQSFIDQILAEHILNSACDNIIISSQPQPGDFTIKSLKTVKHNYILSNK